jgi:hypothetical protein
MKLMKRIRNRIYRLRDKSDESGQSTVEYLLILLVVFMLANKFRTEIVQVVQNRVQGLGSELQTFGSD